MQVPTMKAPMKVTVPITNIPDAMKFFVGTNPGCSMEQVFQALVKQFFPDWKRADDVFEVWQPRYRWTKWLDKLIDDGIIINMSRSRFRCLYLKEGTKIDIKVDITEFYKHRQSLQAEYHRKREQRRQAS
jgi:hypothetical protein